MDIRFVKPPDLRSLCCMAVSLADQIAFKNPFLLTRANIRAFIEFHEADGFKGKFVFDKSSRNNIAFAPGQEAEHLHRHIANRIPGNLPKDSLIGAYVDFAKKGTVLKFRLHGSSDAFGWPAHDEFEAAAAHLRDLTADLGSSVEITIEDD